MSDSRLDALERNGGLRVPGWDGYRASPLTDIVFKAVRKFLDHPPSIVPLASGGIQLEWHTADVDIELEFDLDGRPCWLAGSRASDGRDLTVDNPEQP